MDDALITINPEKEDYLICAVMTMLNIKDLVDSVSIHGNIFYSFSRWLERIANLG